VRPLKHPSTFGFRSAAAVAGFLVLACGGDDSPGSDDPGDGSTDGGGTPADCEASNLFSPRPLGDSGLEVISDIEQDPTSGDLYFSTGTDLYILRPDSAEPQLLAPRPTDIWAEFWLLDDRILLPSGFQTPLIEQEVAVLFTMPRQGGDPDVQVGAPASDEFGWSYLVGSVEVAGDDVYWVGQDRFNDTTQPLGGETTYFIRRTSWRSPGTPEELYSGAEPLSAIIVAGGYAFFDEDLPEDSPDAPGSRQRIIDLAAGKVIEETAEERYGGVVVAGDDDSLLVTRWSGDPTEEYGTWYVSIDGTAETKLGDTLLLRYLGPATAVSRGDTWAFASLVGANEMHVYTFSESAGLEDIGCVDADVSHTGIEVMPDRVVLSTFANPDSSIVVFDR
jgi:hypothetical protein